MQPISLVHLEPATVTAVQTQGLPARFYPSEKINQYYVSDFSLQTLQKHKVPFRKIRGFGPDRISAKVLFPFQSSLFDPPNEDAVREVQTMAMARYPKRKRLWVVYLGRFRTPQKEGFPLDRPGGKRTYWWKLSLTPVKVPLLKDRFKKIIHRILDPDTKVVLSFGSGGIRLFAHPLIMKFLDILQLRSSVKEIWGSSGGAVAGLLYSIGVDPTTIEKEGYDLYNEKYSLRFSPSKLEVLKNLLLDGLLHSTDHLLKGFLDCQSALRTLLQKYAHRRKEPIPFYCVAYNLKSKRTEILTPEKIPKDVYTTTYRQTNALDAVIASSSIPILYVPKRILKGKSENYYVDGGTTEEIPLLSPYRKWIRDRLHFRDRSKKLLIIAVNLFPQVASIKFLNNWMFRAVPFLSLFRLSATYADLIRQARIDEHKGHLARDKDVTLWELTLPMKGANILDTRQIPEIMETARRAFLMQLLEIEESL